MVAVLRGWVWICGDVNRSEEIEREASSVRYTCSVIAKRSTYYHEEDTLKTNTHVHGQSRDVSPDYRKM